MENLHRWQSLNVVSTERNVVNNIHDQLYLL